MPDFLTLHKKIINTLCIYSLVGVIINLVLKIGFLPPAACAAEAVLRTKAVRYIPY